MKLRHVRAVAIFGLAVVALTGARGSNGGSCDNNSGSSGGSSSSSSSTSGGSDSSYDDSTSGGSTTGSTTTGGTTTGSTTGGSRGNAIKDVRIDSCEYDAARGIVAAISATNSSSSETYTYTFQVSFTDPSGTKLGEENTLVPPVSPGATENLDVATAYTPKAGETSGGKCTLSNVKRFVS